MKKVGSRQALRREDLDLESARQGKPKQQASRQSSRQRNSTAQNQISRDSSKSRLNRQQLAMLEAQKH